MNLLFDINGYLKPGAPLGLAFSEIERSFVTPYSNSETRVGLFEAFREYNLDLLEILGPTDVLQWIDGSFISRKQNPGDLDMVSFIDSVSVDQHENQLKLLREKWKKHSFSIDSYFVKQYNKSHRYYPRTVSDKLYWNQLFSSIRIGGATKLNKKGFVEFKLNHYELN
ncbi:MAG: hypothetical protein AAFP08_03070 [Bacteroidota bacterium]